MPQDGSSPKAPDLLGPMWNVHRAVALTPRPRPQSTEARLQLVEDELAIKDLLSRYTYFYDEGDVEGVLSVFHADATLINPRGTYVGREAIGRNYSFLISLSKIVLHLATNLAVRVGEDGHAWMTAYYYSIASAKDKSLSGTGGTYADHLTKVDGEWKIIERRITYNFRDLLVPQAPGKIPGTPAGTRPQSSRDIIGPDFEMFEK